MRKNPITNKLFGVGVNNGVGTVGRNDIIVTTKPSGSVTGRGDIIRLGVGAKEAS